MENYKIPTIEDNKKKIIFLRINQNKLNNDFNNRITKVIDFFCKRYNKTLFTFMIGYNGNDFVVDKVTLKIDLK